MTILPPKRDAGSDDPRMIRQHARELGGWALRVTQSVNDLEILPGTVIDADLSYDTKAALNADLAHDANTGAKVMADTTAANNGYYMKVGASGAGSWTKIADIQILDAPVITAIGGTANAITGTSSKPPSNGQSFYLTVASDNTGTVTLALNGGTARSVRQADNTQLSAGMLRADRRYLLVYDGSTNTFRTIGIAAAQSFFGNLKIVGSAGRFIDLYDADSDAAARCRIFLDDDGIIDFYTGGDGTTAPAIALRMQADGDTRAFGRVLNSRAREHYSEDFPPDYEDDAREQDAYIISPWWEGASEAINVSTTRPYCISGADLGRNIRITTTGAFLDFEGMPRNTSIIIDAINACTLYSGYTGATWRSLGGTTLSVTANSMVHVVKAQSDLVAYAMVGSVSAATVTVPTYARKWAWTLSQSWGERECRNALRGVQTKLIALGLNSDVLSVMDASYGASAISRYAPSVATNYWWDRTASGGLGDAGPNLTGAVTAIGLAAASPSLTDIIVMIGLNDLSIMASSGSYPTYNTTTGWKSDFLAALAYLRTALSLPNLRAWICPLTAQDVGTFSDEAFTAMRLAQLDLVDHTSYIYRGPDFYDLPRPYGDRHHGYVAQAQHGSRLASFITNVTDTLTNYEGPKITGFARTAANTYEVTITRGVGQAYQRPTVPDGFAILAGGDPWATPLTVAPGGYTWSGDNLIIETTTDDVSATLAYPYGAARMQAPSRIVRAQDPVSGEWWPLQTYHPTA